MNSLYEQLKEIIDTVLGLTLFLLPGLPSALGEKLLWKGHLESEASESPNADSVLESRRISTQLKHIRRIRLAAYPRTRKNGFYAATQSLPTSIAKGDQNEQIESSTHPIRDSSDDR